MNKQYRICSIPTMDAEPYRRVFDNQAKAVEALESLRDYYRYLQEQGIIPPDQSSYIYIEQNTSGNWEPLSEQVIVEGVINHG